MSDRPVVTLFKSPEPLALFPWGFRIAWRGVTHEYVGMPNNCATKRSAAMRASYRARWLLDGTHDRRYK